RVERAMLIRAPRSGHILHKNVVEGARVLAGEDLYTIADLSQIWVQAEVYEFDAPWVEVGQPAHMELAYERGRSVAGSVAYLYPTLNDVSRTLTVRLEFKNPNLRLKPGMFATVYIQFRREDDALVVPTEAILHSGKREIVFVAVGDGRFEPREITTGLVGDRHMTQVLSGLEEGEIVVTSGQFLIDSESQLQEAIEKMLARRSGVAPSVSSQPEMVYACPMHPEAAVRSAGWISSFTVMRATAKGRSHDDRADHSSQRPQSALRSDRGDDGRRGRRLGDSDHRGRRDPRSFGRAGDRIHRVSRSGSPGRRGPGHVPALDRDAIGPLRDGRARLLVLRLLDGLHHLRGRNGSLLGSFPRVGVPQLRERAAPARHHAPARTRCDWGRLDLSIRIDGLQPSRAHPARQARCGCLGRCVTGGASRPR
ncbi:MAG: efflux RND transporter periplasmic adaptor subunit, partial [Deltaproteobacteria bacterium]|nr:efflux RND transporter periplasmic adaptor subunit [Deltaproteobacteria bacterium]